MKQKIGDMKNTKRIFRNIAATSLSCALVFSLAGCAASSTASANGTVQESSASTSQTVVSDDLSAYDLEYSNRDLDGTYNAEEAIYITLANNASSAATYTQGSAEGVTISGNDITITQAGTYVLSGTLTDGCVFVNISKEEKCQIVLNGVSISNSDGPCIYVMSADKTFITLAEDTQNTLTDGSDYVLDEDEEPTATIFSKDDLTLNGSGALTITGNYRHAVRSKDDLVITGGTYVINAVENALSGKDCLKICGGTFDITCGEDALKSTNDSEEGRGFVAIDGGDFTISAGDDAVHAETLMRITNGTVNILTCYEGYEGAVVRIDGGTTSIVATDDGINAASGSSTEGTDGPSVMAGDATNGAAAGAGGAGDMGGAGAAPVGETPSGDMNASGGADGAQAMGSAPDAGGMAGDAAAAGDQGAVMADSSLKIIITGGTTYVSAAGDGLDSNGTVEISGGVLIVEGPTSSDDGFFDYDGTATITGGTVLMVGSAGMAQNFSSGTQAFAMQSISGNAGQTVSLLDAQGNEVASFVATKSFQVVLASANGTAEGDTLVVKVGDTETELTASTTATNGGMGGMDAAGGQPGAMAGDGAAGGSNMGGNMGGNMGAAPSGNMR